MELRESYGKLLRRADRLGEMLAEQTDVYLAEPANVRAPHVLVRCVFGIRAWRIIRSARRLLRLRTDDPVGILARHAFELAIEIEYVSTETVRTEKKRNQTLLPDDKIGLYLEYYFIDMERSGHDSPPVAELAQAKSRREHLGVKNMRKWHGCTTFELCRELDEAVPLREPDIREQSYRTVYRTLSSVFVHPNWRGTPWLDDNGKGSLTVARKWECEELFGIALFYCLRVIRFWNETLGGPKNRMLTRLMNDSVSVAKKEHERWLVMGRA